MRISFGVNINNYTKEGRRKDALLPFYKMLPADAGMLCSCY